jgi:hypothetical protein
MSGDIEPQPLFYLLLNRIRTPTYPYHHITASSTAPKIGLPSGGPKHALSTSICIIKSTPSGDLLTINPASVNSPVVFNQAVR